MQDRHLEGGVQVIWYAVEHICFITCHARYSEANSANTHNLFDQCPQLLSRMFRLIALHVSYNLLLTFIYDGYLLHLLNWLSLRAIVIE